MKRISKLLSMALIGGLLLNSCSSDDDIVDPDGPQAEGDYTNGFFVLNEGGIGKNNSTITYVSNDFSIIDTEIFSKVNDQPMGDTGQNITFTEDYAFIVMNYSNLIHIVNRNSMELVHTIESGLSYPRDVVVYKDHIYVTNWGDGFDANDDYIAIYDLENYEATGTISVEEGPEMIIAENDKLYVNLQGGYNFNNKILVIDPVSNSIEKSIEVGDVPSSLEIEDGYLWVMSSGIPSWPEDIEETAGRISKIDLSTNEISDEIIFPNITDHPSSFEIENDKIYYSLNGAVYSMETSAEELPTESLFTLSEDIFALYGFELEDGYFYTGDANDYSSNGTIRIYNMNGELVDEIDSGGVNPNGFYFND